MRLTLKEMLYFIPYLLFCFWQLLDYTMFSIENPGILRTFRIIFPTLIIGLLFIKIISEQKYEVKSVVTFVTVFPIILFVGHKSGQFSKFLIFAMFLFALKNIDLKKLLKWHAVLMMLIGLLVFISLKLGIVANLSHFARAGQVMRSYEGYRFPTFGPNLFFHLTCIWIFVREKKLFYTELLVLALVNSYFFIKTDTKSAFYLAMLAIILALILKVVKVPVGFKNSLTTKLERYLLPVVSMSSVALTILYGFGNENLIKLNNILTGRLFLGNLALQRYPIALFSQRISWSVYDLSGKIYGEFLYVDASFLNILLNFGLIFSILILFGYFVLSFNNPYRTVYYTLAFSIVVIHSMWDPQFLELWFNPFLLFLGVPIFSQTHLRSAHR